MSSVFTLRKSKRTASRQLSSIALVADKRNWAFDNIARHVEGEIERKYPVNVDILFIEDFSSEREFVHAMKRRRYDVVHFFWRRFLIDIFNSFSSAGRQSELESFAIETGISFTICDHLYREPEDILADSHVYHLADGYTTVSKALHDFYASQLLLPPPVCILHDRTDLIVNLTTKPRPKTAGNVVRPLHVIWAGNSGWGQWLGLDDPKGLGIVRAALDKARRLGRPIHYSEFDGAKLPVSNEDIGAAMLTADVLLCASEAEATPLPVLEAMAAGCAVIATDVGVVREVFPPQQEPLIVARDPDAFAAALLRCADNRAWTQELGKLNRAAVKEWCSKSAADMWMQFFERVHRSSQQEAKRQEKCNIVRSFAPSFLEARYYSLRYLMRKSPMTLKLAKRVAPHFMPALAKIIGLFSRGQKTRRLRNFRRMLTLKTDRAADATLAIYAPTWLGVSASTRAIFENSIPVPMFSNQFPWMVSLSELAEYSAIVELLSPRRLIISGGDRIHRDLAVRYKKFRPDARIELIWHGSQLQWAKSHDRELFQMWLAEYRAGTIGKFWVLKRGLDDLLRSQGINVDLIENCLPQRIRKPRRLHDGESVKVGIWSPRNDTLKNLITQFLAFAGNQRFKVYHSVSDPELIAMLDVWQVPHVKVADGVIPRTQLLPWIGSMDLNLYVSLSECSPMIPLESISAGVPVVVGPTTAFFDDDAFLRKYLVVPSPEQLTSIRSVIEAACSNYDAVADGIIRFGIGREALLAETRRHLNHGVTLLPAKGKRSHWNSPDERETG